MTALCPVGIMKYQNKKNDFKGDDGDSKVCGTPQRAGDGESPVAVVQKSEYPS